MSDEQNDSSKQEERSLLELLKDFAEFDTGPDMDRERFEVLLNTVRDKVDLLVGGLADFDSKIERHERLAAEHLSIVKYQQTMKKKMNEYITYAMSKSGLDYVEGHEFKMKKTKIEKPYITSEPTEELHKRYPWLVTRNVVYAWASKEALSNAIKSRQLEGKGAGIRIDTFVHPELRL